MVDEKRAGRVAPRVTWRVVWRVVRKGAVIDAQSSDANVRGVRRFNEIVSQTPAVSATTVQTVGSKGYDGFALIRVSNP